MRFDGPVSDSRSFAVATDVSRETQDRLDAYVALLKKWQKKINLVSTGTLPDLWHRHFLDSAQLLPLIVKYREERNRDKTLPVDDKPLTLVDLGSGAGFPGLVLAIMGPDSGAPLDVHLIESDQRKAAFLREAARVTGADITLHVARIEDVDAFPADLLTARACAPLDRLLGYAERFWGPATQAFFLKGQDVDKEMMQATKSWSMVAAKVTSQTEGSGTVLCVKEVRRV